MRASYTNLVDFFYKFVEFHTIEDATNLNLEVEEASMACSGTASVALLLNEPQLKRDVYIHLHLTSHLINVFR